MGREERGKAIIILATTGWTQFYALFHRLGIRDKVMGLFNRSINPTLFRKVQSAWEKLILGQKLICCFQNF